MLVVLTGTRADLLVAAQAADLAARTGTLLIVAAAVPTTGRSVNALMHQSRDRRIRSKSIAVVARVTPILRAAGVAYFRSTLPVPTRADTRLAVPTASVRSVVDRFGAVAVVTALTLHDRTGVLRPSPHHDQRSSAAPTGQQPKGTLSAEEAPAIPSPVEE
ncbi:hypothetical protein [Paractinoplanes abujensis]|uniref:hypothetical protein n=1 Tax=Paractinoplanes abujensis TaxID=882441 RepID=UPI001943A278|nr:hypothetical protein [Actinoplanes abujensis]